LIVDFNTIVRRRQTPELWQLRKHNKGEFVFKLYPLDLPPAPVLGPKSNPYCGLNSYNEEDAQLFFGRHKQSDELLSTVCVQPLTIVLGASGTGKSSLVKAGLLPRLRRASSHSWKVLGVFRPGTEALRRLDDIFPVDGLDCSGPAEKNRNSFTQQKWIQEIAQIVASSPEYKLADRFLIVVDQVEELVTQCQADERAQFIERLCLLLTEFAGRIHIVLTLRNDFEPHIRNTVLQEYWKDGRFIVAPMSLEELKEVIERPAAERVLYFDPPALVDEIVKEVAHERHALPLLSFTLSELYLRYLNGKKRNRALTGEDYDKIGGVIGIMSRRANEIYDGLDNAHQLTMRHLLIRMVTIESGEKARRRVPRGELSYPSVQENRRVQLVLDQLVNARLLAIESAQETNESFVEPAHEALINSWDKLIEWMREEDETILLHRNLTQAANVWLHTKGSGKKGLLWSSDPRLAQVHELLAPQDYAKGRKPSVWRVLRRTFFPTTQVSSRPTWLNTYELAFIQESIRQKAKFARRTVLLILIFVVATLAVWQLDRIADGERKNRLIAESRRLANIALQEIPANPRHSIELSRSGLPYAGQDRPYVPEAENALTQAIQRNQLQQTIVVQATSAEQVAFSAESIAVGGESLTLFGRHMTGAMLKTSAFERILTAATAPISPTLLFDEAVDYVAWANNGDLLSLSTNSARIWRNGKLFKMRTMDELGFISCKVWSPRSDMIAFCSDTQVWVWLLASDEFLALPAFSVFVNGVSWSEDGRLLAIATANQVVVQTVISNESIAVLDSPNEEIKATRFISSTELLIWGFDGPVRRWSFTGKLLGVYENRRNDGRFQDVQLSPDNAWLAAYRTNGSIDIWPLNEVNATPTTLRGHGGQGILDVAWHDKYLASVGADRTIHIWDWQRGVLVTRLAGHDERIERVAWEPDGQHLVSYSQDETLRVWQVLDEHGFPICDLGDAFEESWRCTTLMRTYLQMEEQIEDVVWFDNDHIVVTTGSGDIWTWRLEGRLSALTGNDNNVGNDNEGRKAIVNRSGEYGFVFTSQGAGELWHNVSGGWTRLDTFAQTIEGAFWSGNRLIMVAPSNQIDVVTVSAGERTHQIILTDAASAVWEASVDNGRLVVAYADGLLEMFELGSNERLFSLPSEQSDPLSDFVWLEGGTELLMLTRHAGIISLIDVKNGEPIWPSIWHEDGFDPLPPVPNPAKTYAMFAIDSALYGLNLSDGTELILAQIADTLRGMQWNQDGSRLLTWDSGGAARIWHWDETELSMTQIIELRTRQSIQQASYSPDESHVLTADAKGNVQVWKIWPTLEDLLEIVPN